MAVLGAGGCSGGDGGPAAVPTGPVDVPVTGAPLPPGVAATCADLVAGLPDEVDPGVERRPVTGDGERTAAWGEPPVLLRCGVAPPERLSEPVTVNGVQWNIRDSGAGFTWTTTDRTVPVEVVVPDGYASPAEIINPVATVVAATVPATAAP